MSNRRLCTGHSMRRDRVSVEWVSVHCPKCDQEIPVVKDARLLPTACVSCRIVFDPADGTVIRKMVEESTHD